MYKENIFLLQVPYNKPGQQTKSYIKDPLLVIVFTPDILGRIGKVTHMDESSGGITFVLKHQKPPQKFIWPGVNVSRQDLPIILTNLFLASLW